MSLLAEVFPKLLTPNDVDSQMFKCLTSENVSVNNVLAGSKHCLNQHHRTITECFHGCGINSVGKSLSSSNLKTKDCLLTH